MKEIELSNRLKTQVDNDDFERFNKFNWHFHRCENTNYVIRNIFQDNRWTASYLHREIMNTPKGMETDHIDHNGLNNQKSNLRICSRAQNQMNRKIWGRSQYFGVHLNGKSYSAVINIDKKENYLGTFKLETEAAIRYDIASMKYHKEFAYTNFHYANWFRNKLQLSCPKI